MIRQFCFACAIAAAWLGAAQAQTAPGTASPNTVYAGPASGASKGLAAMRPLVAADIPTLPFSNITGTISPSQCPVCAVATHALLGGL